jgi:hypothetical protein
LWKYRWSVKRKFGKSGLLISTRLRGALRDRQAAVGIV